MAAFLWRVALAAPIVGAFLACGGAPAQFLGTSSGGEDGGGDATAQEAGGEEDAGGGGDDGGSGGDDGGHTGKDGGGGDKDGAVADGARSDASTFGCNLDGGPFPFDAFPKGCLGADTCVAVLHEVSCCGARQALGIDRGASDEFDKAEKAWEATCPQCECPVNPGVVAEDGKTGPADKVQVKCDFSGPSLTGKCMTFFP
jgi:hypothetical protein